MPRMGAFGFAIDSGPDVIVNSSRVSSRIFGVRCGFDLLSTAAATTESERGQEGTEGTLKAKPDVSTEFLQLMALNRLNPYGRKFKKIDKIQWDNRISFY